MKQNKYREILDFLEFIKRIKGTSKEKLIDKKKVEKKIQKYIKKL